MLKKKEKSQAEGDSPSPEYTIVSAIDDSCVLFAVKETNSNAEKSSPPSASEDGQML